MPQPTVNFDQISILLVEDDVQLSLVRFLPHNPIVCHGFDDDLFILIHSGRASGQMQHRNRFMLSIRSVQHTRHALSMSILCYTAELSGGDGTEPVLEIKPGRGGVTPFFLFHYGCIYQRESHLCEWMKLSEADFNKYISTMVSLESVRFETTFLQMLAKDSETLRSPRFEFVCHQPLDINMVGGAVKQRTLWG